MTGKEFLNKISKSEFDILQLILSILSDTESSYCIIGGLAVNAYVEPVISLDLDIVVIADKISTFSLAVQSKGLKVQQFAHSINLTSDKSDLRVQLQTDDRYQAFISRAEIKNILGYEMMVASPEDVLKGKIWAWSDLQRRKSKRQKDLADIIRLIESFPSFEILLPDKIRAYLDK